MARVRLIVPGRNRTAFVLPDDDALVRPATTAEIRGGGWGDLIPPPG
jgi:ribosomal protein S12